jgi:ABC-type Fe3+ transport system permease subunit
VEGKNGSTAGGLPSGLPSRTAYLVVFASVVLAGVLGGIIGYGIVDIGGLSISSHGSHVTTQPAATSKLIGTLIGAGAGAIGVGIVAVLVLRAMAEWKRQPPE